MKANGTSRADRPIPYALPGWVRELGAVAGSVRGPNEYKQGDLATVGRRVLLLADLERACNNWLRLREHALADGRGTSPTELRKAEAVIEHVTKLLRGG